MSFPNIKITTKGKQFLARALTGEEMEFTKFAIGSGTCGSSDDWANLTGLIAHQMDVPFAEYKREGELVAFAGRFDTSTVERAFWWRELAIYGTLPGDKSVGEVMCFYGNAGDMAEYVHAVGSEVAVTHSWTTKLALSSDADISAIVNSMTYATTQQLQEHTQNLENPHRVTKEQLGLGNVKNLAIENEAPEYEEATDLVELTPGEKIMVAFGKIKKAINALIEHLKNTENPHKLKADGIGAAPKNHRAEGTEYGMGNKEFFGHVKLTDDPSSNATANDGVAVSPIGLSKALENFAPQQNEGNMDCVGNYVLDLRDFVTVQYPGENETEQLFTVTESIDAAALMEAIQAGRTVKIECKLGYAIGPIQGTPDIHVLLTDMVAQGNSDGDRRILAGIGHDFLYGVEDKLVYHLYKLYVGTGDDGALYVDFGFTPAVSQGQQESGPAIVSIAVTEAEDGTVTMVNTLEGGGTETLVLTPDESGNPAMLTYNGTEIPISWTEAAQAEGTA